MSRGPKRTSAHRGDIELPDSEWRRFRMCLRCLAPYQVPGPGPTQRCACSRPHDDERWPGRDINEHIHLCECCFGRLMRSGSKWSPFFCPDCKTLVSDTNAALGFCLIPVGRHSLMNGVGLSGPQVADDSAANAFASGLIGLFHRMSWLNDHARTVAPPFAGALGIDPDEEVGLDAYLDAVERISTSDPEIGRDACFGRLLANFMARAKAC